MDGGQGSRGTTSLCKGGSTLETARRGKAQGRTRLVGESILHCEDAENVGFGRELLGAKWLRFASAEQDQRNTRLESPDGPNSPGKIFIVAMLPAKVGEIDVSRHVRGLLR